MNKQTSPSNPILRGLIRKLRKKGREFNSDVWIDLADRLNRSNRVRSEVNISKLNRHTQEDDTIVVPGKVLGSGQLDHSVSVAAFKFSNRARKRIEDAGGETFTLEELLDKNPGGKEVIIME